MLVEHEGRIPFEGYHTWYRIVGSDEPGKLPVLTLHGGRGACHDYLEPLRSIDSTGRRVVFYDQLGCGNSATRPNPSMWTIDLYAKEIDVVREALGLDCIHLLGQSWGGMLAMEYALRRSKGVASLTIADSPASMRQWVAEANKLRADLPEDVQATLLKHEAAGTEENPEYQEAMLVFYRRHVCRLDPWPECVSRSFRKLAENPEVYFTMNGPSEFHVTGTLKDWDISSQLGDIRLPTLVISGRYDEATPEIARTVQEGIPDARWVLFERSSHMPHVEEPERFLQILDDFLTKVEAKGAA